jgi:hypothetical protein
MGVRRRYEKVDEIILLRGHSRGDRSGQAGGLGTGVQNKEMRRTLVY